MRRIRQQIRGGIVAALVTGSLAFGQIRDINLQEPLGNQVIPTILPGPQVPALESVIDRDTYILGSGDYLEIIVWGNIEVRNMVKVGPDGSIAVPTVGVLNISGKTITEAGQIIQTAVGRRYPRAEISVRLIGIRKMLASVSGRVTMPGMYSVNAVDRLSTIFFLAGGILEPQVVVDLVADKGKGSGSKDLDADDIKTDDQIEPEEIVTIRPSLRRINITSRTGLTNEIDYLRYLQFGDLEFNPILRDGDRVYVPVRNVDVGVIDVYGAVKITGDYEFVEGDRLLDIVDFAGGFRADAMLEAVVIGRQNSIDSSPENLIVDLSEADGSNRGPLLQSGDQIFVRHRFNFHPKSHVLIEGEVKYPGRYPIEDGALTLTEFIERCGGFTEKANLRNSKLFRARSTEKIDLEFERLSKLTVREMSDVEYGYFKMESRQNSNEILLDFEELFTGNARELDVTLWDGDRIEVPKLNQKVRVAGQVNNPGLVAYVPGMKLKDFIREAGGYSWNARKGKVRVIKADTGLWLEPNKNTRINSGDIIFVPEKSEFNSWAFAKDILIVATQLATVFVVVQTVK